MSLITCLTDSIKAPLMTNKHLKIQSTKTPNTKVAALKNGMYSTQHSSPSRPSRNPAFVRLSVLIQGTTGLAASPRKRQTADAPHPELPHGPSGHLSYVALWHYPIRYFRLVVQKQNLPKVLDITDCCVDASEMQAWGCKVLIKKTNSSRLRAFGFAAGLGEYLLGKSVHCRRPARHECWWW